MDNTAMWQGCGTENKKRQALFVQGVVKQKQRTGIPNSRILRDLVEEYHIYISRSTYYRYLTVSPLELNRNHVIRNI